MRWQNIKELSWEEWKKKDDKIQILFISDWIKEEENNEKDDKND